MNSLHQTPVQEYGLGFTTQHNPGSRTDFQNTKKAQIMQEAYRVSQPRKSPPKATLTYKSTVFAGPAEASGSAQKKPSAQCAPHFTKSNWNDLLARTMDANCLVKSGTVHQSRKVNENVKVTMRTLMPEL